MLGVVDRTAKSHMSDEKSKHWRRIWWCIRIRDTIASGSTGRPQHISHRDCDVELLEPSDMDEENHLGAEEAIYASQMARLTIICKLFLFKTDLMLVPSLNSHESQSAGL
jgi:hypothetical protein